MATFHDAICYLSFVVKVKFNSRPKLDVFFSSEFAYSFTNVDSFSERFPGGSTLCCDSVGDSDVD